MLIFLVALTFACLFEGLKGSPLDQVTSVKVTDAPLNECRFRPSGGLMGCGAISFKINTNSCNFWQAIPDPVRPQFSMSGFSGIKGRNSLDDDLLKYNAGSYCPIDQCTIPLAYDARLAYPGCSSIGLPLDEGCNCRGSWAVSAASAFTDRMCIKSGQYFNEILSAQNLLTCCTHCSRSKGCEGGDSVFAWVHIRDKGIVSGSSYGSEIGCQPYKIEPCVSECIMPQIADTPKCSNECQPSISPDYYIKYKGLNAFVLRNVSTDTIKREILLEGPVTAEIKVFEDFQCYHSGIYSHVLGDFLGFTSVKLIGWGEHILAGPYWIAANTWGEFWGEDGFFKISMGTNECNVEYTVSGGVAPIINKC